MLIARSKENEVAITRTTQRRPDFSLLSTVPLPEAPGAHNTPTSARVPHAFQ